ncbi:hypothetical protein [Streptomyces sp. NBC_01304]|uniref:hypothetical protein n=1 Tax=Streptomyces sp. NBC_01304 TaxID=2903818 RepID=UPI002E0E6D9D|nr:hypothetical protein OG430_44525 [Streptomyces sp. NBC_01304]
MSASRIALWTGTACALTAAATTLRVSDAHPAYWTAWGACALAWCALAATAAVRTRR